MARPMRVVIPALATADPDGAVLSTKAASSLFLAINGALTDGGTANNIAQSQTPAGAGNFTLNGTLVSGGVAYLGKNSRIYFTGGSDESGDTYTITGTVMGPAGELSAQVESLAGPNASIVASQKEFYSISQIATSGAATGALTIGRAGIATFDAPRRVVVVSAGNDASITFQLIGTDHNGSIIIENLAGTNASTATSALSFKTLLSVKPSAAVATTVTVGSSAIADSRWVRFDDYGAHSQVSIQVNGSGTVNWTVRQTLDDPNSPFVAGGADLTPAQVTWVDHPDSALVASAVTTGVQGSYGYRPVFAKIVLNSGTGSVNATFAQAYQD